MFIFFSLIGAFGELFGNMSASIFIVLTAGVMLVITEFYQPVKKIFGTLGTLLIATGIIMRILSGADALVIFLMVFFVIAILCIAHMLIMFAQKKSWLKRAQNIQAAKNAPGGGRLGYLKNMTGIAVSDIDGNGNISINDTNFTVTSDERIEKGSFVRVTKVIGDEVKVELFDPEEQM